nr:MBL fold metallo-hydrolase [Thermoanaerobacterales bacterium]
MFKRDRLGNVARAHVRRGCALLNVSFFGVRGSTPCPCDENRRYGGNTSCVQLDAPGHDPIVFDLGTGLRRLGQTLPTDGSFRGAALVTHMHWDHVQGLPFFGPILAPGAKLDVYGPSQEVGSLADAFRQFVRPPFFPVTVEELYGQIEFHDVDDGDIEIDGAKVRVRPVPHVGANNGYRVEVGGATVAYIADHQMPHDGSHRVSDDVLELCDGADLVIHDAQYTVEEFAQKYHWGHCTVDYAVFVAHEAGARRLALFHHDPAHDDDTLDDLLAYAQRAAEPTGLTEVISAYEGLTVSFGG